MQNELVYFVPTSSKNMSRLSSQRLGKTVAARAERLHFVEFPCAVHQPSSDISADQLMTSAFCRIGFYPTATTGLFCRGYWRQT
jgi:hypothetical protein